MASSFENIPSPASTEPVSAEAKKNLVFEIRGTSVPIGDFDRGNSEKQSDAAQALLRANELVQAEAFSAALKEGRSTDGISAGAIHERMSDVASPDERDSTTIRPVSLEGEGRVETNIESTERTVADRIGEVMLAMKGAFAEVFPDRPEVKSHGNDSLSLEFNPRTRKALSAGLLVAGLGSANAAEAGWLSDILNSQVVSGAFQQVTQEQARARQMAEQRRMQEENEARQAEHRAEMIKSQYANETNRVMSQYENENDSVERQYENDMRQQLGFSGQDESVAKRMLELSEKAYHKAKLRAAERAYADARLFTEKFVHMGATGAPYQSQVIVDFMAHLQRVAAKEVSMLKTLGVDVLSSISSPSNESRATQPSGSAAAQERGGGASSVRRSGPSDFNSPDYSITGR